MEIASSAIGFFNFAVDCFGRIQLARDFEDDYPRYQLKLDILQIRLTRWAQAADIRERKGPGPETFAVDSPEGILAAIEETIKNSQFAAKKEKVDKESFDPLDPESDLPPSLQKIRAKFRQCCTKRRAQFGEIKESVKWAFYKKDKFDKFVADISGFVESLEQLVPEENKSKFKELSKEECNGFNKPSLEELKDIVKETDPWMNEVVEEQLQNVPGSQTYNITQSHIKGTATGVQYGDVNGQIIGKGAKPTQNYGVKH